MHDRKACPMCGHYKSPLFACAKCMRAMRRDLLNAARKAGEREAIAQERRIMRAIRGEPSEIK